MICFIKFFGLFGIANSNTEIIVTKIFKDKFIPLQLHKDGYYIL